MGAGGVVSTRPADILGIGCVAVDDLLYVEQFPPPDAKVAVLRRERQCGGLCATALVSAARLGASCAYAGTLGFDDLSKFALSRLRAEGVDVSAVSEHPDARPISSVIVVDEKRQTRNVFSDRTAFLNAPALPIDEQLVRGARVLLVDHVAPLRQLESARIARQHSIPIVADFERDNAPGFEDLYRLVDHLVVSRDFAHRRTGQQDPAAACFALRQGWHAAVVVTAGGNGAWAVDDQHPGPIHIPAFAVHAIDTTGCGDAFHGGYAAFLAEGLPLPERIRRASAVAALKATQAGGQRGLPDRAGLESFLMKMSEAPDEH